MASLRIKILLILVLLLCAVGSVSFGVGSYLLNQSLLDFEQRTTEAQLARVETGLLQYIDALIRITVDYAIWDDTVEHMGRSDSQFLEENFTLESMKNIGVDSVLLLTLDNHLHSGVDARSSKITYLQIDNPLVSNIITLMRQSKLDGQSDGGHLHMWFEGQPFVLGFSPVSRSSTSTKQVGWMVMVRLLDKPTLQNMAQSTGSEFYITQSPPSGSSTTHNGIISKALTDSLGNRVLRLNVVIEEGLAQQRHTGLLILLANALVLMAIAAIGAVLVFDRLIFKRLELFATKAQRLRGTDEEGVHEWPVQGNDELDMLALALNDLVGNLERSRAQLILDSRTDALTGLGNRRLLLEKLSHFLSFRQRQGARPTFNIAVLLLDIDDFKIINDSLGHEAGNFLLKEIARSLQSMLHTSDVVARLGGDEFAIIYTAHDDEHGVDQFASRVQEIVSMPRHFNGSILTISASIGIAMATPTSDQDTLLRNADLAMYASKAAGKCRHSFFQDAMLATVQERMQLEQQLRECLARNELEVWFQPIIDVRTNQVTMFEALARWPLAGGGFCPPDRFIPVAEESGLIHQLGVEVARKVVAALSALHAINPGHIVNINLAPKQLMSRSIVNEMCSLIDAAGLPRSCVHFELTESALATDASYAMEQIQALAMSGFHLHLDDFGTGYSSLHRLSSMPFSTLKLDRSFVIMMANGDERIARIIITLAEQLDMNVIAEGIETADQQDKVVALGCHLIQGYYHAKPMPIGKLLQWLKDRAQPVARRS